jgi:hypothetical protein
MPATREAHPSEAAPKPQTFAENAILFVKIAVISGIVLGLLWLLGRTS